MKLNASKVLYRDTLYYVLVGGLFVKPKKENNRVLPEGR